MHHRILRQRQARRRGKSFTKARFRDRRLDRDQRLSVKRRRVGDMSLLFSAYNRRAYRLHRHSYPAIAAPVSTGQAFPQA